MNETRQTAIPGARRRATIRWYHLYYLLAAFDLITVSTSLYLGHLTLGIYTESVTSNREWAERLVEFAQLAELVTDVNAPGNDVFTSRDVESESDRLDLAGSRYRRFVRDVRLDIRSNVSESEARILLGRLEHLDRAVGRIEAEAQQVFRFVSNGQTDLAGQHMSVMDRHFAETMPQITRLVQDVGSIERKHFASETARVEQLGWFEVVIAGCIILIIGGVTFYGRTLATQMAAAEANLIHAKQAATEANAAKDGLLSELRSSESRLMSMFTSSLNPLITIDERGIVEMASDSVESVFGWTRQELVGQNINILMPESDRSEHNEHLANYKRSGVPHLLRKPRELSAVRRDGTVFPCEVAIWEVDAPDSSEGRFMGIIHDITERNRDKEALLEQTRLLTLHADVGTELTRGGTVCEFLQCTAELLVQHFDAAFARVWTYNEDERMLELQASAGQYTHIDGPHSRVPLGKFKIGLIASEQRPHFTNDVQNDPMVSDQEWAQREGMVAFAGYPLVINGKLAGVVALFARHPLAESATSVLGTVANTLSVAIERLSAQEHLVQFRAALDASPDAVFLIDRTSMRFIDVNDTACADMGYSRDELLAMAPQDIKPEVTRQELEKRFDAIIKSEEQTGVIETVHRRKDGTTFPVESFLRALDTGEGMLLIACVRDVSERRRAETQLADSELRYRTLFESTATTVMIFSEDRFVDCNEAAIQLFGCSRDELLTKHPGDFSPPTQGLLKYSANPAI